MLEKKIIYTKYWQDDKKRFFQIIIQLTPDFMAHLLLIEVEFNLSVTIFCILLLILSV